MIVLCGEMGQLCEMRTTFLISIPAVRFSIVHLIFDGNYPKTAHHFQAELSVSTSHDLDAF